MSWFTSILKVFKDLFTPTTEETPETLIPTQPSPETQELLDILDSPTVSVPIPVASPTPAPAIATPESDEKSIVEKLSKTYGLNPRMISAVAKVESSGSGFRDYKGLGLFPTLRFEPHWFNKYEKKSPMTFTNNGKGFSSVASETNHVAYQKAYVINPDAAIKGTSFGKFQIMGFHFSKLGFETPTQFLESMKTLEGQYDAFVRFVMSNQKLRSVVMKDMPTQSDFINFARAYNGSGNVEVYSKKIEKAYNSFA